MAPTTDFGDLRSNKKPVLTSMPVTFRQAAGETLADVDGFFTATRACKVIAIREVHSVAGNDAGAVTLQVKKCTGTQAASAGAALLTNNSNAGFDLKGTANTVQTGTLVGTEATLKLAAGNRLALDLTGTPTNVAGVSVVVELELT